MNGAEFTIPDSEDGGEWQGARGENGKIGNEAGMLFVFSAMASSVPSLFPNWEEQKLETGKSKLDPQWQPGSGERQGAGGEQRAVKGNQAFRIRDSGSGSGEFCASTPPSGREILRVRRPSRSADGRSGFRREAW